MPVPVQLVMPDGQKLGAQQAEVILTIHDKGILTNLAAGQVGKLGEDYVDGKFDVDGSMRDLMQLAASILPGPPVEAARGGRFTSLIARLVSVWRHSIERDAKQIEFHYDVSDDFYALWLDPRRVYSCGYYKAPDFTLAQAQEAKLDHICRKLKLQAGERFLDVGAGWGGLLLWAAEHYDVDATGITLSRNQHAYVNRLIEEKGLSGRVRMELLVFRNLVESQPFYKIASDGMFADVGSGWGGQLLWADEHYDVDATGITLSRNQHAYVNRLIEEKGLSGRVRMELLDYRKLDESQPFDKIASVGMFEHVGRAQLKGYFSKLRALLTPGGLLMNHGITAGGIDHTGLGAGMGDFIEKFIFPGGELTHISQVLIALTEGGLEGLDIENLRPHYARTLWAWSDALEKQLPQAREILQGEQGERSLRAYRMNFAVCELCYENGWNDLHH